jgi:hypothetical protein
MLPRGSIEERADIYNFHLPRQYFQGTLSDRLTKGNSVYGHGYVCIHPPSLSEPRMALPIR